jgi:general secretion pathway protein C
MWRKYISSLTLSSPQVAHGLTWGLWASAAYGVVSWSLQIWASYNELPVVSQASTALITQLDESQLARSLGAQSVVQAQAPSSLQSRFKLLGVVADSAGSGVALISVDTQEAKPYRMGQAVVDGLVVQSVLKRRVMLAPHVNAEPTVELTLPVPDAAVQSGSAQVGSTQVGKPQMGNSQGVNASANNAPPMGLPQANNSGAPQPMQRPSAVLTDAKTIDTPDSQFPPRRGNPAP